MTDSTQSRRRFLSAGAGGLGASAVWASGRVLGANDRMNVGMIGLGRRGTYLLQLVLKRAAEKRDVQVVAVSDVYRKNLNRAAQMASESKKFLHHEELLAQGHIDAVFIATPDHWHAPITLGAFSAGKDVYCEKPISLGVEEALMVEREAEKQKRILQVGAQALSWSKWRKAKEVIGSGALGPVISCHGSYSRNVPMGDWNYPIDANAGPHATGEDFIDWKKWLGPAPSRPFNADHFFRFRKYWAYSGGIATDLHYHTLAPFHLAVANEYPTRVVGMGGIWLQNDGREVPDTFLNAADYPGKWSVTVQSSQHNEHGPRAMIRGQFATMLLTDDWGGNSQVSNPVRIVGEKPYLDEFRKKFGSAEVIIPGTEHGGNAEHVDNFFECIRSREQPSCNASIAARVMVHIGLSVRSYREGKMFYFDSRRGKVLDHFVRT